ncbi:MAG: glycosyltransferase [Gemmatimonadetes bacterium]|uniref:Glycosyltransferase n=1 Tax=Candidatus Kutchimonas denitrificans TaxID=3056748 RepID=A0AAE5C8Z1_9BACT|nr:glycosyltransferase [Gemmatimonadota bacterium]NIR74941.1 glycosyltransferase [Candidatus Kutchimonas denitrificans]NIS00053.1 glycosyltransferase [Gemmatimonadota bacterium]NIT65636.1 glycosyltransferase [Gemmatimonadota bacterium]NIU52606.1 glycosyltransferase [Gemmatimonadota bacterium]
MSFQRASVIVSTYNRPDALERVLLDLDRQTVEGFEVVVADDGSSDETRRTIDEVRGQVQYPLRHTWQEDHGFRAARARNLAVGKASGDYLIFLDGDCLPRPDFLEGHRWLAERGRWVRGNRVNLTEEFTERVLSEELPVADWPLWRWVLARLRGEAVRTTPLLRLRTQALRKSNPRKWRGARSCNFGCWRDDFMRVDGYDDAYTGWGREDSDLAIRLINAGVYRKDGRYVVPVLHLWHPSEDRSAWDENDALLNEVLESGAARARLGISQHLSHV